MILQEIASTISKNSIVQLITQNISGDIYGISMPVLSLIEDWYGNCLVCPENGESIWNVVFYYKNKTIPLISGSITFEELMRELEKTRRMKNDSCYM
jgi:hypothetical protein